MPSATLTINQPKSISWRFLTIVSLTAAAATAPLIKNQFITGPLVNTCLYLAAFLLSPQEAILTGLFPSLIALTIGLLPIPLAPMVPFIMTANALLVLAFSFWQKRSFWQAIFLASLVKYLFLQTTSLAVAKLIAEKPLVHRAMGMMSWPQLLTALAGGIIAFGLLKFLKKD